MTDWDARSVTGDTRWDEAPAAGGLGKPGRALARGGGRGHDAAAPAATGWETTIVGLSPTAAADDGQTSSAQRDPSIAGHPSIDHTPRRIAEALLCRASGAERVVRMCPHCGASEHGQPLLVGIDLHTSIAYTAGLVAVAWSSRPVGIDVERSSSPRPPSRWRRLDTRGERTSGLPDLAEWTRTEALAKAAGTGLRDWPRTPPPETPTRALTAADGLPAGYVGTLADATGAAQVRIVEVRPAGPAAAWP